MTAANTIVAKASVAFVAIAMAFSLVAPAIAAEDVSDMSLEELIALVQKLQGQVELCLHVHRANGAGCNRSRSYESPEVPQQ